MKLRSFTLLATLVAATCVGCSQLRGKHATHANVGDAGGGPQAPGVQADDEEDGDDGDEVVALDQVPANVKSAALAAVPGLVLSSAEREVENAVTVYSLSGTANGEACEVEVSADGHVLEIERGEDDDDG